MAEQLQWTNETLTVGGVTTGVESLSDGGPTGNTVAVGGNTSQTLTSGEKD